MGCMSMNYMTLRRMPSGMYASETHVLMKCTLGEVHYMSTRHTHHLHAHEVHSHKTHPREICVHEMHGLEQCREILDLFLGLPMFPTYR
jgi:hypothetical protein